MANNDGYNLSLAEMDLLIERLLTAPPESLLDLHLAAMDVIAERKS